MYWQFIVFPEQMDEGLAGRQRQYEGLIHNLSKELNFCKIANQELNIKLREMCGPVNHAGEQSKGENCSVTMLIFNVFFFLNVQYLSTFLFYHVFESFFYFIFFQFFPLLYYASKHSF